MATQCLSKELLAARRYDIHPRANRLAGHCEGCDQWVAASAGRLVRIQVTRGSAGAWSLLHRRSECTRRFLARMGAPIGDSIEMVTR